jgi:4-hydroxy-tetrahydrodipicolinate synthase
MKRFEGIFTVMLSPYDDLGDIDRDATREVTDYLIGAGVHGLVALGSNGECPYLCHHYQKDMLDTVIDECGGRIPVIVGINERGAEPALEMATYAAEAGADGLLVALSIFYRLDPDAVADYYHAISCAVDIPVLYYNFPSNTGLIFSPHQIAELAERENLAGAKETIFDLDELKGLVEATGEDFSVFTGMSFNLLDAMALGACGAICPLPNIIPEKIVALYEACRDGDGERARALQDEVNSFAALLASSPTPHAMLKEAMRLLGHEMSVAVKNPLPQLTEEQASLVEGLLREKGMI